MNPVTKPGRKWMEGKPRIETYSIPEPNSGCWIWLGVCRDDRLRPHSDDDVRDNFRRAQMSYNGRATPAARVAYQEYIGVIPGNLHVLHRCDTPLCVNPDHLFLGTHQDNADDKVRKGRHKGYPRRHKRPHGLGVTRIRESGMWLAYVGVKGKQVRLGTFKTKDEALAARARGVAEREKEIGHVLYSV